MKVLSVFFAAILSIGMVPAAAFGSPALTSGESNPLTTDALTVNTQDSSDYYLSARFAKGDTTGYLSSGIPLTLELNPGDIMLYLYSDDDDKLIWSWEKGKPSSDAYSYVLKRWSDSDDRYEPYYSETAFEAGDYCIYVTSATNEDEVITRYFTVYDTYDLSTSSVSLSYYTGILGSGIQTPTVTVNVMYGYDEEEYDTTWKALELGKDYIVKFYEDTGNGYSLLFNGASSGKLTKAGEYRVEVSPAAGSQYTSTQYRYFSVVTTYPISDCWIDVFAANENYQLSSNTYTDALEIDVKVYFDDNDRPLTKGVEYNWYFATLAGSRLPGVPTAPGNYLVVVQGQGSFTGTHAEGITLVSNEADVSNKQAITSCSVRLGSNDDYFYYSPYTGAAITPSVVVGYWNDEDVFVTLTKGTDYDVTYANNVNAGRASVVVTGKGNYYGSYTRYFWINPLYLSSANVTIAAQPYTGSAIVPTAVVKVGDITLKASDYTVTATNNINVGIATATITAKGENVQGSTTKRFSIESNSLATATVNLSASTFTYNGAVQAPTVSSVVLNGKVIPASDYTVSIPSSSAVGTYTVTVTGKGSNITGVAAATYNINPVNLSTATVALSKKKFTYNGKTQRPKVTSVKLGTTAIPASGYSVTYAASKKAGTYSVKVTGTGVYQGSASASYTITKAANPIVAKAKAKKLAAKSKKATTIKTAKAFKISKAQGKVTYKKSSGNKRITVSKKGVVTIKKGLKPATYSVKVKVTAAGNTNYKSASKIVTLKIKVTK